MPPQKDSARTLASAGNIDNTAYWGVVNRTGQSVRATLANIKTALGTVSSMVGDVSGSVAAGVATTTIGALKVLTGMIADSAVTYAKMQNVSATSTLWGRFSAGTGAPEEIAVSSTFFSVSGGTLAPVQPLIATLVPPYLTADQAVATTAFVDVTGVTLPVAANKTYFFEFWVRRTTTSNIAVKLSVTVPASPTSINFVSEEATYDATDGGSAYWAQSAFSSRGIAGDGSGGLTQGAQSANGTARVGYVRGVLVNGANAGNIQLRACGATVATSFDMKLGTVGRLTLLG